jgi:hypothetical protein
VIATKPNGMSALTFSAVGATTPQKTVLGLAICSALTGRFKHGQAEGKVPMPAAAAINHHQANSEHAQNFKSAKLLEIFRERAEARAVLVHNGHMSLIEAVDGLWAAAERAGLVRTFGADHVQRVLSESISRWRL